jgi:hypothetical protein
MKVMLGYVGFTDMKMGAMGDLIQILSSGLMAGINYTVGSLLPVARNELTRIIYNKSPDFTHILYVDTDMTGLSAELVADLIRADKDIIAPVMTGRAFPFKICNYAPDIEKAIDSQSTIECETVGTGCMLVKKAVLDAIGEATPSGPLWFHNDRQPRPTFKDELDAKLKELELLEAENPIEAAFLEGVKIGLNAHRGTDYLGEDITFCKMAKRNGFRIWTNCKYTLQHIGECAYGLDDTFAFRRKIQQYNQSIEFTSEVLPENPKENPKENPQELLNV